MLKNALLYGNVCRMVMQKETAFAKKYTRNLKCSIMEINTAIIRGKLQFPEVDFHVKPEIMLI